MEYFCFYIYFFSFAQYQTLLATQSCNSKHLSATLDIFGQSSKPAVHWTTTPGDRFCYSPVLQGSSSLPGLAL